MVPLLSNNDNVSIASVFVEVCPKKQSNDAQGIENGTRRVDIVRIHFPSSASDRAVANLGDEDQSF